MLRACLEAAGYRVHAYTSPHLIHFNERIRIAGQTIADDVLVESIEECETANDGAPITFFEIVTAAALLAFSRIPADILLLETGLGGRLDATNVVTRPAVTAITPVTIDHQAFLGTTLPAIAREKAGILKPGVTGVIGPQAAVAARVIAARAQETESPLQRFGREWRTDSADDGFDYQSQGTVRRFPAPSLAGAHQVANAGIAITCLDHLRGFDIADSAIAAGLQHVDWPARLQLLDRGRLAALLPEDWELWVDGGHNAAAGAALAAMAENWRDRPLYLLFGMSGTKNARGFLQPLAGVTDAVRTVALPRGQNSLTADQAADAARRLGMAAVPMTGITEALTSLAGDLAGPARILICGSLYLAGAALAENGG